MGRNGKLGMKILFSHSSGTLEEKMLAINGRAAGCGTRLAAGAGGYNKQYR